MKEAEPGAVVIPVSKRLSALLTESESTPLTVFLGPCGCGKTTALLQLEQTAARSFLFNTPAVSAREFWQQLCGLIAPGTDPDAPLPLLARAATAEGPLVLLVDDYHHAACPELNERLLNLALAAPGRLRVALAGRKCLWPPFDEAVCTGRVLNIDPADLSIDRTGIASLFRARGRSLTTGELQEIFRNTLGWPMAVRQLLNDWQRTGSLRTPAALRKMLEQQWKSLPDPLPEFLLRLAPVAGSFCEEQATFLWGDDRAPRLLDRLREACFYLSEDNGLGMYHFHPLLVRVLREQLAESPLKKEIFNRLARWFKQKREYLPALRSFYHAEDLESMLGLLDNCFIPHLPLHALQLMHEWYAACTVQNFRDHPFALLQFVWYFFLSGDALLHGRTRLLYLELLKENPPNRSRMQTSYDLYLASSCLYLQELPRLYLHLSQDPHITESIFAVCQYPMLFGSPIAFGVMRSTDAPPVPDDTPLDLPPEADLLTEGKLSALMHAARAESLFMKGRFDDSRVAGHRAVRLALQAQDWNSLLCVRILQAKFYFVRGRPDRVQDVLSATRRETLKRYGPHSLYVLTLDQMDATFHISSGQMQLVANWILSGDLDGAGILAPARPSALHLHALSLLQRGLCSQLLSLEDILLTPDTTPLLQIYNLLLLCGAHERMHASTRADAYLRHAASMAQAGGIIMPFVELYRFVQPAVARYNGTWKALLKRIPELGVLFNQHCAPVQNLRARTAQGLSARENEIAHLAARGLYNKEIASQLSISENTVKSALKSIYEKLDIPGRRALPDALATGLPQL